MGQIKKEFEGILAHVRHGRQRLAARVRRAVDRVVPSDPRRARVAACAFVLARWLPVYESGAYAKACAANCAGCELRKHHDYPCPEFNARAREVSEGEACPIRTCLHTDDRSTFVYAWRGLARDLLDEAAAAGDGLFEDDRADVDAILASLPVGWDRGPEEE